MTSSALVVALALTTGAAGQYGIWEHEVEKQDKTFKRWWDEPLEWRFDHLPAKGGVTKDRVPYAGCIYPDLQGGTVNAMWKYDQAFHNRRTLATSYERWDNVAYPVSYYVRNRWGRSVRVWGIPHWAGHCNGWTSASIRHAEPQQSVVRNGVTFTPSDIKGLLAELYMWNRNELLGGEFTYVVNPGTLHVIITNWLGRKSHPVAMESSPGSEVWNYPAYAYSTSHGKQEDGREIEVKMRLAYKHYTEEEHDKAPENNRELRFHYHLYLDKDGRITGGWYYWDSHQLDLLWVARTPSQAGTEGNPNGNPHLKLNEILSIWRDSVPEDLRNKWVNIELPENRLVTKQAEGTDLAESGPNTTNESPAEGN